MPKDGTNSRARRQLLKLARNYLKITTVLSIGIELCTGRRTDAAPNDRVGVNGLQPKITMFKRHKKGAESSHNLDSSLTVTHVAIRRWDYSC